MFTASGPLQWCLATNQASRQETSIGIAEPTGKRLSMLVEGVRKRRAENLIKLLKSQHYVSSLLDDLCQAIQFMLEPVIQYGVATRYGEQNAKMRCQGPWIASFVIQTLATQMLACVESRLRFVRRELSRERLGLSQREQAATLQRLAQPTHGARPLHRIVAAQCQRSQMMFMP
ncbi:hypothetical protein D9M71_480440 [compost metagenome]